MVLIFDLCIAYLHDREVMILQHSFVSH